MRVPEISGSRSSVEVSFRSSLKDEAWHNLASPNAYESWHFDAVSDDGREALVITFHDNYVLSPRFHTNSANGAGMTVSGSHRIPAVSFVYSVDGRPVLTSVNEFVDGDFKQLSTNGCSVGASSFSVNTSNYGSGYLVIVDIRAFNGRRIRAELEWLLIESDLLQPPEEKSSAGWNIVAPRADVSGKISLIGRRGATMKTIQFRGTGYHDHVTSSNIRYADIISRIWGRAHFVDSTIVFEHHGGFENGNDTGTLILICDGKMSERVAVYEVGAYRRDRWGFFSPGKMSFVSDDGTSLCIRPITAFRSGLTEMKMLSEITLILRDGKSRQSIGITEFADPIRLSSRLCRWISDLRIYRG